MPPQNANQARQNNPKKKWGIMVGVVVLLLVVVFSTWFFWPRDEFYIDDPIGGYGIDLNRDLCSGYFGVCLNNGNQKWATTTDTRKDFGLLNKEEGISLSFIYSTDMEFKDADPGFTSVNLLGQTRQVYKDNVNSLTRALTGTAYNGGNLIILLTSNNDITAERVIEIVGKIEFLIKIK